ncbi:calcium-binding protein [Epibacterium sp. MM17-32]|uniref:calcium-binding protein n=1 Tax=Epibacterium sp. MM17-32 TaxID=2917734 RepID=UPI001EF738E2|nr:calcium-binding protein [Epibacterium sp. MM17-32]MCG7630343.1 calcium-binding protein [Epibacterium sp. MM17-32]
MTTYSLSGITVLFSDEEDAVANGVETGAELHYYLPDGAPNTLRYTTGTGIDGETDIANINDPSEALVSLNGGDYPDLSEEFILEATWNDNGTTRTTIVLGVDELYDTGSGEDYANRMSIFVLSGDALPSISTAAEWLAFEDSITSIGYPSGTYAPNQDILLSNFFPSSSEDDEVHGTSGDDLIETGAGNDNIYGNGGDDTINGGDDEDWMVINRHNATLDGGEGGEDFDDAVIYDYGDTDVLVEFDAGNEEGSVTIQGRTDLDDAGTTEYTVTGSNIERVVLDTDGEALIEGNDNDNRIRLNEVQGVFTFNGGGGTDQVDLHRTWVEDDGGNRIRGISLEFFLENTRLEGSADSLTIYDADDDSLVGVLNDVEVLRFSDRTLTVAEVLAMDQAGEGDVITGNDSREDLTGTSDNDTITGGGGYDTLDGGAGNDEIDGGTGGDNINGGFGDDTIHGGTSTDLIYGDEGNDSVTAGTGDDTVYGGDGNDTIFSNTSLDTVYGGAGDDYISSGDGVDYVEGGEGNDTVYGRSGWDTLFGGDGDDSMYGSEGDDELSGGTGNDWISAGSAWDTVYGNSGDDTLYGNFGSDVLSGGLGEDEIYGGTGDDTMLGGADDDTIYGMQGVDRLEGGTGNDLLRGGTLVDTFVFDTGHDADEINDFETFNDRLELSSALVDGLTEAQDVIDTFASIENGVVVFDFGEGDAITISNLSSLAGLADNIDIV